MICYASLQPRRNLVKTSNFSAPITITQRYLVVSNKGGGALSLSEERHGEKGMIVNNCSLENLCRGDDMWTISTGSARYFYVSIDL